MDCKDGEVRYHVSHLMEDGKLEDATIQSLFGTAMGTADRYFPALMRVLFAGETPAEAIDLAELHKFESEDQSSKKAPGAKASSTPSAPRKPRAKRSRKAPPVTPAESLPKPQDEHSAPDTPSQGTPPHIPPSPHAEGQDSRPGIEGKSGDCKGL